MFSEQEGQSSRCNSTYFVRAAAVRPESKQKRCNLEHSITLMTFWSVQILCAIFMDHIVP